jgi:DNA-binding response OmpR family regulator
MKQTIAVLDDEPDILELVSLHLSRAGFDVLRFDRAATLFEQLRIQVPDLLVLDLMLPDIHGTEVCRRIRSDSRTSGLPVIMLTAMTDESDRVSGLETGADDYVSKPFSPRELVARVRAVLRRSDCGAEEGGDLVIGSLVLHPDRFRAEVDGRPADLTPTEFRILLILAGTRGRVFTRSQILDALWQGEKFVFERTVDVHIRNIREKLGSAAGLIRNVRGIGYRLEDQA